MDKVQFGYSKWKTAIAMFGFGYLALSPLILGLTLTDLYSTENKSMGDMIFVLGIVGSFSVIGAVLLFALVKKVTAESAAVVLDERGIRTNVSGLSERFYPWQDISDVKTSHSSRGVSIVRVTTTAAVAQKKPLFQMSHPGFVLWHHVLDCNSQVLTETISKFIEQYKTVEDQTEVDHRESLKKAA